MENTKENRNENLYHNTELLLKKYRDVVWSIEVSMARTKMNFEIEFGTSLNDFLDMSYAAGADLTGTDIEEQMRTLERNRKMLEMIDSALDVIRTKHRNGGMYYQILYYAFISDEVFEDINAIIAALEAKGYYMSVKTYFKRRKEAINFMSDILWGFTSKQTSRICADLSDFNKR